jgi:hypothetical protein
VNVKFYPYFTQIRDGVPASWLCGVLTRGRRSYDLKNVPMISSTLEIGSLSLVLNITYWTLLLEKDPRYVVRKVVQYFIPS